ncbi:MAG: cobalamin-dependent protein [Candidatus Neomarinimicrobiota bacterium]
MNLLQELADNLIAGKMAEVASLTEEALNRKLTADLILNEGLLAGMSVISKRFKDGIIFIPEVLIAARAMNKGLQILEPQLAIEGSRHRGTLLIGTVQGDLHDIGKNLVGILFRGAGFKVIDLGTNVSTTAFMTGVQKHDPDIIGLSALLTTTMTNMADVISLLRENGIQTPVIVGGAPLSAEFAASIKADAFAASAAEGVEKVLTLMGQS